MRWRYVPVNDSQTMDTYPIAHKNGLPFAFEVQNAYALPRRIARILSHVDGVSDVRLTRWSGRATDTRLEFKYLDRDYVVWEPYGDSSRYWIGPKNTDEPAPDITPVENAFKEYRLPFYRALIGDVLTLRILKRLVGRG